MATAPKVEADNTKHPPELHPAPAVHPAQWNVQPHEVLTQIRQERAAKPAEVPHPPPVVPHPVPVAPQRQPAPPPAHRIDATPHAVAPPPRIDSIAHGPQTRVETTPRITTTQPQRIHPGQQPGQLDQSASGQNRQNIYGSNIINETPNTNNRGNNIYGGGNQNHERHGSNYKPLLYGAALGAGGVAASNYYRRDRDSDNYGLYNGGLFDLGGYDQGSQFYGPPLYGDPAYGGYADPLYADGYQTGYQNPGYGNEIEVPPIFDDSIGRGITVDDGSYTQFRNNDDNIRYGDNDIEVPSIGSPPGIVDGYYNPQPYGYGYARPYQNGPDILGQALPNLFGNIIGNIIGNATRRPYGDNDW